MAECKCVSGGGPCLACARAADREPVRFSVDIVDTVRRIATALQHRSNVWGGGAGAMAVGDEYVVQHPTEEGGTLALAYADPWDAAWAYLKAIGGSAYVTIEAPEAA